MNKLMVQTSSHEYPIYILSTDDSSSVVSVGERCVEKVISFINGRQVLIVSNDVVAPIYLEHFLASLTKWNVDKCDNQLQISTCILPDGEVYKRQSSINKIYDALMENHFSRDCTLIALGGGVIGDMTGFAAASYMRGVNFIQVPTTLLAQVDSSVGGKTGINHPLGKNMIGAFWQPQLVVADMSTLKTLPERELSAGLAEVIKYALIMDVQFLSWLENNMSALISLDMKALAYAVEKCCQLKAQVVSEDEREAGKRAILNFGHTFGHVIETHQGYGNWLHGEAVAVGMVQACQMSHEMGWISKTDVERCICLIQKAKLPIHSPNIELDTALELMSHDKKAVSGNVRLVLLRALGDAVVTKDFPMETLTSVLSV